MAGLAGDSPYFHLEKRPITDSLAFRLPRKIVRKRRSQTAKSAVWHIPVAAWSPKRRTAASMPRYTFADDLPRQPPSIWDADTIKAWALEFFCGTLRNRDVAREPTWRYSRRSRKNIPMTAPSKSLFWNDSGLGFGRILNWIRVIESLHD